MNQQQMMVNIKRDEILKDLKIRLKVRRDLAACKETNS